MYAKNSRGLTYSSKGRCSVFDDRMGIVAVSTITGNHIYSTVDIRFFLIYIYTSVTVHECSDYLSGRCVVPTTIIFDDFLMRLIRVMLFDGAQICAKI